ncbi:hypothetical protein N7468_001366 [Penicillium chermesinum]|uniref:Mitochondrial carrier protein pet8 protein n=1 Tax=Penicillium chermesinum TaxID=63820 RepID=A0A9W9TXA0_9EURO|nr:uncharacterized protein N7468_001366 [Penicillium chermesinum]KAJ5246383.1 hypothetical protein N7468_001366 [Penicillium chermesinum]KAJ6144666.1 hypothetical protein N7470_008561 [Penicillium chermesinum]
MSFLTAIRGGSRHLVQSTRVLPSTSAAFHTANVRQSLKESDKTDRDDLAEYYEAHKEEQLKSTKEGKGKWKHELASNSEAEVKADRGELDPEDKGFQQMQEDVKKGRGSTGQKA